MSSSERIPSNSKKRVTNANIPLYIQVRILLKYIGFLLVLWLLIGCSTAGKQPDVDPAVLAIAMKGVESNKEWEPYIETINGVEMALVPTGCFEMGSDQAHNTGGELPIHTVCFDQPFWFIEVIVT